MVELKCRCALDGGELAAQMDRYRALAQHVGHIEHEPNRVVVRFAEDPPGGLLERTLEVERGCCPFFEIEHEPADRRLTIGVDDANRGAALDEIAAALSRR